MILLIVLHFFKQQRMNKIKETLKGCSNPCTTHPI